MTKILTLPATVLGLLGLIVACAPAVTIGTGEATVDDPPVKPYENSKPMGLVKSWHKVWQGWTEKNRLAYWYTPQGSHMLPYEWFLHLELPDSRGKFRGDRHMRSLGYLSGPRDDVWNPDALPIGFAKSPTPYNEDSASTGYVGPTCAACHSNLILANGTPLMVDGAPTLADFQSMNTLLVASMEATRKDDEKFDRFARAVLKGAYSPETKNNLGASFLLHLDELRSRNKANYDGLNQDQHYGFGRLDAIGAILNQVSVEDGGGSENAIAADAPVSYPFLWGTSQSSVVQWNGLAKNQTFGFGPLGRNVGEVIGVYGKVRIELEEEVNKQDYPDYQTLILLNEQSVKEASSLGYPSSIMVANLGVLENWLKHLRAPKWPRNLLGDLDQERVARGKQIYFGEDPNAPNVKCSGCHEYVGQAQEADAYEAVMIPVSDIGTDPRMAQNFLLGNNPDTRDPWFSGKLEGTKSGVILGDKYGRLLPQRASALETLALGATLGKPWQAVTAAYWGRSDSVAGKEVDLFRYKARPLTGIWATAPYLHNGSVATLAELLNPSARRSRFWVGSRVFDVENVGFVADEAPNLFELDTSISGNSNAGHSGPRQGANLTAEQRRDLLEFLKTL